MKHDVTAMTRTVPAASPQPARRFFFLLLAAATVLFALVVRPLASALFLAAVLAGVLLPVHRWLSARLGERRRLAGVTLVSGVTLVLLVPVVAFSTFAVKEASDGVRFVSQTVRGGGVTALVWSTTPSNRC